MSTIRTRHGHNFNPLSDDPGVIDVYDIAHALSNLCRFTGHTSKFYSVGQHSFYVAQILQDSGADAKLQMQGLLHDATEAYLTDVSRPIKMHPMMRWYREFEERLEFVLAKNFGFETLTPPPVQEADGIILAMEARDLMGDPQDWNLPHKPLSWIVNPVSPDLAKRLFLDKFFQLKKEIYAKYDAVQR